MIRTSQIKITGCEDSERKWHKNYYVWLIISFPLIAVIAGFITLFIAISTHDGLVVDDYYKQGLEINKTFDREQSALTKQINAVIHINDTGNVLRVVLKGNLEFVPPESINVKFIHATRSGFDQVISLKAVGVGVYEGPVSRLIAGNWNVFIDAQDWRIVERYKINRF